MLETLAALIPVIVAAIATPVFSLIRNNVTKVVPDHLVPVFLPIAGAVLGAVAHLLGVDATILQEDPANVSGLETVATAVMTSLAMIGFHQMGRQLSKGK